MRVALLIALVGCRQVFGIDEVGLIDAPSLTDVRDACTSWSKLVDTCTATFGPAITIGQTATLDTDSHVLTPAIATLGDISVTTPEGVELDVVFAESFDIAPGAIFHVVGSRPFAIVTPGAIAIAGTLDLRGGGAGSRMACSPGSGQRGVDNLGGGGGGGGGGFGAAGGHGGSGDSDGAATTMGGAGGLAVGLPVSLVGGCPGGRGGDGNNPSGGAGIGGGAVLLASMMEVDVRGQLLVSGGGGKHGGCNGCGGGGGGSGGMIVIEAPIVMVPGVLSANGGGGGEGEIAGNDGGTGGVQPGHGGVGGTATGGDGADGGSLATPGGTDATDLRPAGGGGGGGGCGFVAIATAPIIGPVATIDPPYVAW